MMDDKLKKILEMYEKAHGSLDVYDDVALAVKNIYNTMVKRHPDFYKMSIKRQVDYIETIGLIVIDSKLQHMDENAPLSRPSGKVYKYSIDKGRKEKQTILLESNENLLTND